MQLTSEVHNNNLANKRDKGIGKYSVKFAQVCHISANTSFIDTDITAQLAFPYLIYHANAHAF
jgi:uncharacterized protein (DUF302 family)